MPPVPFGGLRAWRFGTFAQPVSIHHSLCCSLDAHLNTKVADHHWLALTSARPFLPQLLHLIGELSHLLRKARHSLDDLFHSQIRPHDVSRVDRNLTDLNLLNLLELLVLLELLGLLELLVLLEFLELLELLGLFGLLDLL